MKILNEKEQKYKQREKKIIFLSDLKAGDRIVRKNIGYKVTNEKSDLKQRDFDKIINKKLKTDVKKNNVLKREYIDY